MISFKNRDCSYKLTITNRNLIFQLNSQILKYYSASLILFIQMDATDNKYNKHQLLQLSVSQLQSIIKQQQSKISNLKDNAQSSELTNKRLQYKRYKNQYKTLMKERYPIISEKSSTLNYLSEHFYEEGIFDKVQKVLYQMANITKQGEGRSSISDNGSIQDYQRILHSQKEVKLKKEEEKLRMEIQKLEGDVEYEKIYLEKNIDM